MAIAPLRIAPTPEAANAFDFAPLAKLAQQINQPPAPAQPEGLAALGQGAAQPSVFDTGSGTSYSRKGGGDYAGAISKIESGGNYGELGPVTKSGDRAYGKYQIMGNNIPEWSRAALGRPVTTQEFLANPQLQDTIFQHRFGQYVDKYGPGGAARAWFAGPGGMNNPNATDQLGTSVASYERRFLGGTIMAINQLQIPTSGNINNLVDQSQWQSLSNLGNVYQKAQQDAANKQAFAQFQQTGDPKALIGSGDMNLAKLGVEAQNHMDLLKQQGIENTRADINTGINRTNADINQARAGREAYEFEHTPDPEDTTPTQRAAVARKYGIDPNSPEGKQFILAGTLPAANQGVPSGYQRMPDGSLSFIPHGPEDPETIKSQADAKRPPGMGDDALKPMVESYGAGNTGVLVGIGRGTQGPQNLQRFWELLSQKLVSEGKTGTDLAAAKANFMSQTAAAKTAAVREASVESAVNEAKGTFPLILQRSAELPRSSFVPYNKLLDMVRTNTSSPEQNRYNAAIQSGITAYSQAMSRTGASTVHSQQHAEDIINKYSGPEGIKGALEQLQQEMDIAKAAPEETRKSILNKIIGIKTDEPASGTSKSEPVKIDGYTIKEH